MARTRTLKTFTFDVLDTAGNPIPGCTVSYNREDGYEAFYAGQFVGYADSRDEADLLSIEAANKVVEQALTQVQALASHQDEPARPVNVFSEPFPASSDEALARHLVGEINELEAQRQTAVVAERWQGELRTILDRYDAKSAQVRALGFEIAPGPDGLLVLCDANRTPLFPQPATIPTTRYILRKPNGESADDDPAGVAVPAGPRPNGGGGLRMLVVLTGTARQLRDLVATASAA